MSKKSNGEDRFQRVRVGESRIAESPRRTLGSRKLNRQAELVTVGAPCVTRYRDELSLGSSEGLPRSAII